MTHSASEKPLLTTSEGMFVFLLATIQFINVLDFMMVMPMGPDLAEGLSIPLDKIGIIGGSYTFAASISGFICAFFLDRFPRKSCLIFCLVGLVLATLSGAFVWNETSMVVSRVVAGLFGGPLTSVCYAMVSDYILPERRGAVMGKIAGGFAVASVFGVPFGLELTHRLSWHAPFIVTAILGALTAIACLIWLPYHRPYRDHKTHHQEQQHPVFTLLKSKKALLSYGFMGLTMMSSFMIIPNIASHFQMNWHFPRESMGLLYGAGGFLSFFSMRFAGTLIDRFSSTAVISFFTLLFFTAVILGFILPPFGVPVIVIFCLFMVSASGRMMAGNTLSTKIPAPHQRAAYMSIQSSITHMGSALGAFIASQILVQNGQTLSYVSTIGIIALCIAGVVPFLTRYVESHLRKERL